LNNIIKNYNVDGEKKMDNDNIEMEEKDILKLYKKILDNKIKKSIGINNKNEKYLDNIKNEINENENMMKELINEINHDGINNDIFNVIENLITFFENIIGENININNENLYLKENVYIIDHDYKGKERKSIVILEKENKIIFKRDDEYFKQNIYYYYDIQDKLTLYYDATDLIYLGYKEQGNNYIRVINTGKVLIKNHSIKNKLLYLGFSYLNYKIPKQVLTHIEEMKRINDTKISFKLYNLIVNIIRDRVINLKNILLEYQKIFYQIKKKYTHENSHHITKLYINKFEKIEYILANDEKVFSKLVKNY
jgi:hypothetical protein